MSISRREREVLIAGDEMDETGGAVLVGVGLCFSGEGMSWVLAEEEEGIVGVDVGVEGRRLSLEK